MSVAKTVTLTKLIPSGLPSAEHFEIVETPAPTEADVQDGGFLLQVLNMSADPYLRGGCKRDPEKLPRPMVGFVSGKVVASKTDKWAVGDLLGASLPFTSLQVVSAEAAATTIMWKLTDCCTEENLSLGVGVLGMPGSTAYGGVLGVLRPLKEEEKTGGDKGKPETLWVSGSAGAVGSLVGQIAKQIFGCTVIGSCGGSEKGDLCKEKFGFDHAIDYKKAKDTEELTAMLKEAAPEGIDMYFDNVGGSHFEAACELLRPHGRIAVCGAISHYNEAEPSYDRIMPSKMIYTFQRIEGFVCMPWLSGQKLQFLRDMKQWIDEGKIQVHETFFDGIEQWPAAFQSLFTGLNKGKVVVKV